MDQCAEADMSERTLGRWGGVMVSMENDGFVMRVFLLLIGPGYHDDSAV